MMQWWKCKHGAPFDTKWRIVARRVNGRPGDVWAVASTLIDAASQSEPRGDISRVDLEEIAEGLGYEMEYVRRIYEELRDKKVHDGQLVLNFERHQTAEDTTAAERKRRQRDKEKRERDGRDSHDASQNVTSGHEVSRLVTAGHGDVTVSHAAEGVTVTLGHAPSHDVTVLDERREEENRPEQIRPEEGSLRSLSAREGEILDERKPIPGAPVEAPPVALPDPVVEIPDFLRRFPDDLKQFLVAYPATGEGPDETFKAWKATQKIRPDIEAVLASVANYVARMASENLVRPPDNQRQACHPSKWLREKRWVSYAPLAERPKIEGDAVQRDRARRAAWGGSPAVEKICAELGEPMFDQWFAPCRLTTIEGVPVLHAPSRLVRDMLANKHMDRLEAAFGRPVILELNEAKMAVVEAA